MTSRIGFIGAGDMGQRMARRLIAAGHQVSVCDANPAILAAFEAEGVAVSRSPRDVAGDDIIIIMVSTDDQIFRVLEGDNGILAGLDAARKPVVLIMSTCLPKTVKAVAESLRRSGANVIDAPVSGGLGGAESGTLSIMAGGEAADIERVDSIFRILGRNIFHCGPLGAGQTAKLINNMIGLTNVYLVSEAYAIAQKSGTQSGNAGAGARRQRWAEQFDKGYCCCAHTICDLDEDARSVHCADRHRHQGYRFSRQARARSRRQHTAARCGCQRGRDR